MIRDVACPCPATGDQNCCVDCGETFAVLPFVPPTPAKRGATLRLDPAALSQNRPGTHTPAGENRHRRKFRGFESLQRSPSKNFHLGAPLTSSNCRISEQDLILELTGDTYDDYRIF